jgi:hypothetical protein
MLDDCVAWSKAHAWKAPALAPSPRPTSLEIAVADASRRPSLSQRATLGFPMTIAPNDFTQLHVSIAPSLRTKP